MSESRPYTPPGFAHGLLLVVLMLLGAGLVMVYSATTYRALVPDIHGNYIASTHYLMLHIRHMVLAIITLMFCTFLPLNLLEEHSGKLYIFFGIVMMIIVIAAGTMFGGSKRWLNIAGLSFQPGEFAKIAFCIWLAYSVGTKDDRLYSFKDGLLPNLISATVLFALFGFQPDLGSSIVLGVVLIGLLYIGGARLKFVWLGGGAAALFFLGSILFNEERMARVAAWLNPEAFRDTEGFQLHQAVTSVGSGQWFGRGLGEGPQNVAGFVPEAETDFIYATLSEELGFVGSLLTVAAFAYILWAGVNIASRHTNRFRRYLGLGLTLLIVVQAGVHICVNTGVFPTKGLTLPFLSLGGSSLIAMSGAVGLLLNLSRTPGEPVEIKEFSGEKGDTVYVRARS